MFKPATSKEGNSEVYVICLRFKGLSQLERGHMEFLTEMLDGGIEEHKWKDHSMIASRLLTSNPLFVGNIVAAAKSFTEYQASEV